MRRLADHFSVKEKSAKNFCATQSMSLICRISYPTCAHGSCVNVSTVARAVDFVYPHALIALCSAWLGKERFSAETLTAAVTVDI